MLPTSDGAAVEYGYGSWSWYARNRDRWYHAPLTVLWPNQGTLGRRILAPDELAHGAYAGRVQSILVDRDRAARLVRRLDAEFASGGAPLWNPVTGLHFVKHAEDFWMFHDCHDETAEWLRELGCEVGWAPIRGGLRVADEPRSR